MQRGRGRTTSDHSAPRSLLGLRARSLSDWRKSWLQWIVPNYCPQVRGRI